MSIPHAVACHRRVAQVGGDGVLAVQVPVLRAQEEGGGVRLRRGGPEGPGEWGLGTGHLSWWCWWRAFIGWCGAAAKLFGWIEGQVRVKVMCYGVEYRRWPGY